MKRNKNLQAFPPKHSHVNLNPVFSPEKNRNRFVSKSAPTADNQVCRALCTVVIVVVVVVVVVGGSNGYVSLLIVFVFHNVYPSFSSHLSC